MKQKGIAPVIFLIVLAIVSVAAVGLWFKSPQKNSPSESALVVSEFCDNFLKDTPAINEQGVMKAYNLLSKKAKASMSTIGPSPSAALAQFAGIQDVPDQGYTIDSVSEGAEKATIKTTWKYSGGPINKTFDLSKEDGSWKIDKIR